MDTLFQFGALVHWLGIALQLHLILRLWRDPGQLEMRPLFVWYTRILLITTITLFVGYHSLPHYAYSPYYFLYWGVTSVEAALAAGVVGEIFGYPGLGLIMGLVGAIDMNLCGQPVTAARIFGVIIALAAFFSLFRENSSENKLIAAGLLVFLTFPAILYQFSVPEWTTYVPVYAGMCARLVWLKVPKGSRMRAQI